jgi:hypothetical protein
MNCTKYCRRLLVGTASGGSIIGLILLPKCPLCLAMLLATIGVTSFSAGQLHSGLEGLLVILSSISGWTLWRTYRSFRRKLAAS